MMVQHYCAVSSVETALSAGPGVNAGNVRLKTGFYARASTVVASRDAGGSTFTQILAAARTLCQIHFRSRITSNTTKYPRLRASSYGQN